MPEDGEVAGIDPEAVVTLGGAGQGPEEILGSLEHGPARLADEMAVRLRRQMVRGRAVPEMGMDDDPEPLQFVQVAVDGRQVDVGSGSLDRGRQLFGRPVGASLEEAAEQQASGGGDPTPVRPHQVENMLNRIGC